MDRFPQTRWHALAAVVALPFAQGWSDTGLIQRDDDWSGVAGVVGHRGDGLTSSAGADPRLVVADGSATPVDVNANEPDPLAVGLAAGVAEFHLPDPVVALQGSATAAAPHLVLSLDTRGRSGVTISYRLRDVDPASVANAVQAVALHYRVGDSGDFTSVPAAFVPDATTGPGAATLVTPVKAALPAVTDDKPLVQVRVLTTNANGQDEWVGIDDIHVDASGHACPPGVPAPRPPGGPPPPGTRPPGRITPGPIAPGPPPPKPIAPSPAPRRSPTPPRSTPLALTELALAPPDFKAAKKGPAVSRSGRAGTSLSFRLPRPASVRFRVLRTDTRRSRTGPGPAPALRPPPRAEATNPERGRFSVPGRRGLNRLRFSGRVRGRPLPAGAYRLVAVAVDRSGDVSATQSAGFRILPR
jgi:hypothetical protein